MSVVGAVTTVSGREFQSAITRLLKKFKRDPCPRGGYGTVTGSIRRRAHYRFADGLG